MISINKQQLKLFKLLFQEKTDVYSQHLPIPQYIIPKAQAL